MQKSDWLFVPAALCRFMQKLDTVNNGVCTLETSLFKTLKFNDFIVLIFFVALFLPG